MQTNEMIDAVFVAMRQAYGVRQEPMTPGAAYKMAGELGQAMFGLNTWTEDKDEAGAARAAQCRAVHDGVMEKVVRTIRIQRAPMLRRTGKVFKTWEEAVAYRDKHDLEIIIERWGAQTGTSYLVPWQPKQKETAHA